MFDFSSFSGGFSQPEPPISLPSTQAEERAARDTERELGKGILPATLATLRNLASQNVYDAESAFKAFGADWNSVVIVGWITELDESDPDRWTGQICDGTAAIDFSLELASDMPDSYHQRLSRVKPRPQPDENVDPTDTSLQAPVKMFGCPSVLSEGALLFNASHVKAATADEATSSHFLECGLVALAADAAKETAVPSPEVSDVPASSVPRQTEGVDPYFGSEIAPPADVAPFMSGESNRIKRVIWRFLTERADASLTDDKSESTVAVRSFCGKRWTDFEVNTALDAMDEDGIVFYVDQAKERVALV